jgi:CBS-domain-containing membrane protein
VYPVVDAQRRLLGVVTHRELGELARNEAAPLDTLVARDLTQPTEAVTLDVQLLEAARRLGTLGVAAIPVVDAASSRVLGTVGRASIVSRYGRALADRTG